MSSMLSSMAPLLLFVGVLLTSTHAFLNSQMGAFVAKTTALTRSQHGAILKTQSPPLTTTSTTRLHAKQSSKDDKDDSKQSSSSKGQQDEDDDEEWFPMDAASTTPQLLSALWFQIAQGSTMERGESSTLLFPNMEEKFSPSFLNRLLGHLDSCKDVCDDFGTKTVLIPYAPKGTTIEGFTIKSYGTSRDSNYEFDYDPFWDDGSDWNYEGIDEQVEGRSRKQSKYPDIVNRIPDDDEEIIATTKVWVDKMMSDMGICPFTSGPNMAGLPMGPVYYAIERCTSVEMMYARFWKEVVRVEQNPERDLSTTLLICPEFCVDQIDVFEEFGNTLTQALTGLGVEDLLQLVFFHPQWTFRDGGARAGEGSAANYARRSPWPMINLLRTKQVRAAQRGIPTGLVYTQNEKTLSNIGVDKLETMLRLRDWSDISDIKVNRRDMEALRVAQDFQQTGVVSDKDTSFAYDATPAANKVEQSQIEGSNLVNVIKQALEKRLGKNDGGEVTPLSGPETSATVMASDFLLQELTRIAESPPRPVATSSSGDDDDRMKQARQAILEDMAPPPDYNESDEMDVLFGGKGIMKD